MKTRRRKYRKNRHTRRVQKGGIKPSLKEEELKLVKDQNTVELYKKSSREIQQNKKYIIRCFSLLANKPEEMTILFKLLPRRLQQDVEIVTKYVYYAPLNYMDIPKHMQRKEIVWKTALKRNSGVFFLLPKKLQVDIQKNHSKLMHTGNNTFTYNIEGLIKFIPSPALIAKTIASIAYVNAL